jgi:hypothetical protein
MRGPLDLRIAGEVKGKAGGENGSCCRTKENKLKKPVNEEIVGVVCGGLLWYAADG